MNSNTLPSFSKFLLSEQISAPVALQAESRIYCFLSVYSHFHLISHFKPVEIVSVTITYYFLKVPLESSCFPQTILFLSLKVVYNLTSSSVRAVLSSIFNVF